MTFPTALQTHFPGALPVADFVVGTQRLLGERGFEGANTIVCVGTCRDELCVPLRRAFMAAWGEAFNFSSLAGMLLLGTSGFRAAHAHAPVQGGRERYLYVAMPHIGLGGDGSIGTAQRIGRAGGSTMCGALHSLHGELHAGPLDMADDPDNPEFSILRRKLSARLRAGEKPSLIELTRIAQQVIETDLTRLIDLTVEREIADFAVLTGIQVHGPEYSTYVQPGLAYTCVLGERRDLDLAALDR